MPSSSVETGNIQWTERVRRIREKIENGASVDSPDIVRELLEAGSFIESSALKLTEKSRERVRNTLMAYLMREIMQPLFEQDLSTVQTLDDVLNVITEKGNLAYNLNPMLEEQKILPAVANWGEDVKGIAKTLLVKQSIMDADVQRALYQAEHLLSEHLREIEPPVLREAVQRVLHEDILKKRMAPVFEKLQTPSG